jgi:hypothetical protein
MRKICVASLLASAVLSGTLLTPAAAKTDAVARPVAQVSVTFRLQVGGHPASGATFWVAYGPLAGRFGLVRLHRSDGGVYTATRRLPATGRAVFAYLAGNGVVRTRVGLAPGNPVVTIERFGPALPTQLRPQLVHWRAPVG